MALSSISITAPDSTVEGEQVSMSTTVTNISADSYLFRVRLYAVQDIYAVPAPEEIIGSLEVVIGSGQSQVVSGTFTMPAWDATILVMVHRFVEYWDYDNHATKVVSLEAAPPGVPEYKGWRTIGNDISLTVYVSEELAGWQRIGDDISLTVYATEIIPPVPPEEVPPEINWPPIILIGGGVALATVALKPKKTRA